MVPMVACSCATCASSAMVTLSRKRRCRRVLTVRRNHVAAADTASPIAAPLTSPGRCCISPLPSSISHKASSASGNAASCDSTKDATIRRGSCRYPSLHSRHIDDRAGGSGPIACSGEDVIRGPCVLSEPLRLEIEHRLVAAAKRHQLVVRSELDDAALLENANAIGVTDGREAMRDQDGGAAASRRQQTIEDLRFAADVELRGGLVEQHEAGAERHRRERAGEC